ncbi:MAG: hypothetical protein IJO06_14490 [Thermoguttaceae bacterium]|nr:hypothetical protein [Thermoguttaceae bacterium]MBQ8286991.1 hypothetical protein [Thermoguttaceae bacterium]MBQ9126631.1 hypothetical protein [Thermoguttaceae bacterium]
MIEYAIGSALAGGARALGTYWAEKIRAAAAANQEIVRYAVDQKERVEGKNIVVITTVYFLNQAGNIVHTASNREVKPAPKKGLFGRKPKKQASPGEPDLSWLGDIGDDEE